MSIKQIHPLLIGDLCAGVVVNDDDVAYIALGINGEEEERFGIDEIEANALLDWLEMALGSGRNTGAKL
jgi:hypothetical protein